MIFSCLRAQSLPVAGSYPRSPIRGALVQIKLRQFQIARLGNLQINLRTGYDGYRKPARSTT